MSNILGICVRCSKEVYDVDESEQISKSPPVIQRTDEVPFFVHTSCLTQEEIGLGKFPIKSDWDIYYFFYYG